MEDRWMIETSLPVSFVIKKSVGIFDPGNPDVLSFGSSSRRLLVIDLKVSNIYLKKIIAYFDYHNVDYHVVVLNAVEREKNTEQLLYLLRQMEQFNLTRRNEPIIAIGGGVLLDIVGLAAGLYRRGVPYIRVPTTLIGLVDACVGSKTAVNFFDRRNRIGFYYPPVASYLDKTFLKTLEPVEISSGLGEILKMAVIKDSSLFSLVKEHGRSLYVNKLNGCGIADSVIDKSITGMKEELEDNLWERDLKRSVDFGHSFSPILEMRSLHDRNVLSLTHGQAVALDVIFSSVLSFHRGMLDEKDVKDVVAAANDMGLPVFHPYFGIPSLLLEALHDTVKHRNGDQNLPIPDKIGSCVFLNDVSYDEIKKASVTMKGWCKN